nr:MAG: putative RNA-dependent RNA polymerase [Totiviridae sp.]
MLSFGVDWFKKLARTGIMKNWNIFSAVSREVSVKVKKYKCESEMVKQHFGELSSLLGYQQLPFPGDTYSTKPYDLKEEMNELAKGGEEHGLEGENWNKTCNTILDELIANTIVTKIDYISFEDFVKEGKWLTNGSSSIGEVFWERGEESGHFKARKNMLLELYTAEELIDLVNKWDCKLKNKTVIKNELGKVRLAVASPIEDYLIESYLFYLTGHLYKQWQGITLDETPSEELRRTLEIQSYLAKHYYCLPFDYAGFDRQVTTDEVTIIVKKYFSLGLRNVPFEERTKYNNFINKIIMGYRNQTLTGSVGDKEYTINVEGGLPSGVRITSLIGNIWNCIMTKRALEVAESLLDYNPAIHISLRGDDSLIVCRTALECYIVRLGYQSINAIGNSAKFGITQGEGEFLRTVYTAESRYGWVNRSIPSITQRKPWNPEVWEPNQNVKTIKNNIDLLERRLDHSVDKLHLANKIQWSKWVHQSYKWLELPKRLGGVGLYRFEGWITDAKLSLSLKPSIFVQNLKGTQQKILWINLSKEEEQKYNQLKFEKKIISSDIPGMQKYYTREVVGKYKKLKTVWRKTEIPIPVKMPQTWPEIEKTSKPKINKIKMDIYSPIDEQFPVLNAFLQEYSLVSRIKKINTLREYLEKEYPEFYVKMRAYERQGFHRTDAIDLARGLVPIENTTKIHPILTPFIQRSVEEKGIRYIRGRKNIALKLYNWTRSACIALSTSRLSRLYRY